MPRGGDASKEHETKRNSLEKAVTIEVRYETLLKEPQKCISGIASFLGIDDPDGWLNASINQIIPRVNELPDQTLLLRLPSVDLIQINECDDSGFFLLSYDAGYHSVSQLMDEVFNMPESEFDARTRGILSVLATNACQRDKDLSTRAHTFTS